MWLPPSSFIRSCFSHPLGRPAVSCAFPNISTRVFFKQRYFLCSVRYSQHAKRFHPRPGPCNWLMQLSCCAVSFSCLWCIKSGEESIIQRNRAVPRRLGMSKCICAPDLLPWAAVFLRLLRLHHLQRGSEPKAGFPSFDQGRWTVVRCPDIWFFWIQRQ